MEVANMQILRWMCGHTIMDKIRNQVLRERLGVAPVSSKMREIEMDWACPKEDHIHTCGLRWV